MLDKKYAHYDWGRRPLPQDVLQYALDDVVYLPEVGRTLREEVEGADLLEETEIANQAVMEAIWSGEFSPDGFWKIKGARRLAPHEARLLRDLFAWRERIAEELDRPPGRVINNKLMLAMSRNPPRDRRALGRAGVRGEVKARYANELLALVRASASAADEVRPPKGGRQVDRAEVARGDRLRDWRRAESERRKVPPQVVLPPRAMDFLKQFEKPDLGSVPQLGAKRIRLYGEELLGLCRG